MTDQDSTGASGRVTVTTQTAVSIGVIVVIVGAILGLLREVYGVRSEIAPELARIGAKVEAMVETLQEVRRKVDQVPADGFAARLSAIETRLQALEVATRK